MEKIGIDRQGKDGNTKHPCPKQPNRLTNWFMTWNNYPLDAVRQIEDKMKPLCTGYTFQEETGESGTPHLQGVFMLKKAMRYTEFKLPNTIHWEKTRNSEAAENYCKKDDTRTDKVYTYPAPIKTLTELYIWQVQAKALLLKEPNDRTIYWFYDQKGKIGKSQFVKYMVLTHDAIFVNSGEEKNIYNIIFKSDMEKCTMVLIDIPRAQGARVCYTAIEAIKNGLICNTKYETGFKAFNSPHVAIFSNSLPDPYEVTLDRWNIYEIFDYDHMDNITERCLLNCRKHPNINVF